MKLNKDAVKTIEEKYPDVFWKTRDVMSTYFDEDMTQRF